MIELSPEIDKGDILIRKRYNPPKLGMDIDHLYDNQIRADLYLSIDELLKNKSFEMIISQNQQDSTTYYVIHPIKAFSNTFN